MLNLTKTLKSVISGVILFHMHAPASLASIEFEDVTAGSGVEHVGASFGASWGNFNNDGRPDLWVGNHATTPDLFLNQANNIFTSVDLGPTPPGGDMHGASWADFDNDGDQDLIILAGSNFGTDSGPNLLLVNSGAGLSDEALAFGVDYPLGRGRTPLWIDWNRDGLLDLLISNENRSDGQAATALFTQLTDSFSNSFPETGFSAPSGNALSQLMHLDSYGLTVVVEGNPFPSGVYDIKTTPFVRLNGGSTLFPNNLYGVNDVAIADFNGDQLSDIFISASRFFSGVLIEDGEVLARIIATGDEKGFSTKSPTDTLQITVGPSSKVSATDIFIGSAGVHPNSLNFTLSSQDPNSTGIAAHAPGSDDGVYIGYDSGTDEWQFYVSDSSRLSVQFTVGASSEITTATPINFSPSDAQLGDHLFLQTAGGGFIDSTVAAGLDSPTQCESIAAADFDNDMDVDLYMLCQRPLVNAANVLFENDGNANFTQVTNAGGAEGTLLGRGDTVAVADYDTDGFIDLFLTNSSDAWPPQYGPSQLFRNTGNSNHWIEIDLHGVNSNRDGIGARVVLTAGGVTQVRTQDGGMHNKAQNHQRIHFGLGDNTLIDEIRIEWPNGAVQQLWNVQTNQLIRVIESAVNNSTPAISGIPSTTHNQDSEYNFIPTYTDTDGDIPLFSISNKPKWGLFDPTTGRLSGTPGNDDVGITTGIVISVTDQKGQINSTAALPSFDIQILNVNDNPIVKSPVSQQLVEQDSEFGPLNIANHFTDPDNDALTYSINGLPDGSGLQLSPQGSISGRANQADADASPLNVSVTATDTSSASATLNFEVVISPLADSNGDGLNDKTAIRLGLDPMDTDGDTDGDGVSDITEIGGNFDAPLDLDGDGRIDALEPGNSANDASIAMAIALPGGEMVDISTSAGESLSDISITEAADQPAGLELPVGLISYSSSTPLGGQITITLNFSIQLPDSLTLFKIDSFGNFTELPTNIWQRIDSHTVAITLTDGDPLTDQDGTVNGSVLDPLAIATATSTGTGSTSTAPETSSGGGGGGCTTPAADDHTHKKDPLLLLLVLSSALILLLTKKENRT